jgi:hypothetical protein
VRDGFVLFSLLLPRGRAQADGIEGSFSRIPDPGRVGSVGWGLEPAGVNEELEDAKNR